MKKVLLSLGMLTFVAAAAVGGTGAFFSDEEVSEDNVFTAGELTLTANSITHQFNGDVTTGQQPGFNASGFSFELDDLKPSDEGVLTYDLTNGSNDATVCVMVEETGNHDNGVNGPESDAGDSTGGSGGGELGTFLNLGVEGATGTLAALSGTWFDLGAIVGGGSVTSAIDYCFGEIDGSGACVPNESLEYNLAQTDSLNADVTFYAEQTRGNDFTCQDLNDANRPLVGAMLFSYSEPAVDQCDFTVDPTATPDLVTFNTLTAAEAAATGGEVICVDTGNYVEDVVVDTSLTFLGLNDPSGPNAAIVDGRMDVDADDVTITGLQFTDPDGGYGVVIDGVSNTEISNNVFSDIGTTLALGSAQAIYYNGGGVAASDLTIADNEIDNIGNVNMEKPSSGSSAKGIFIGDSTAGSALSNVLIENNSITNIFVSNAAFPTGRGAYGVLVNYGVGVSSLTVTQNTIQTLDGLWSHGVGLETDTPGAVVTRNDISDLVDNKSNTDAIGVFFEGNPGGATTVVNENNFGADIEAFAVALHSGNPAVTVNAENNWWGDVTPADEVDEQAGTIDFTPFETAAYPTN